MKANLLIALINNGTIQDILRDTFKECEVYINDYEINKESKVVKFNINIFIAKLIHIMPKSMSCNTTKI